MTRNGHNNGNGNGKARAPQVRCAVYTRKSTEEGLEKEFNSLDAQREAAEAYIASQKSEGWVCLPDRYDDGGYTGGNMDRPALGRLLADIEAGKVDCVAVYKVDRISRSLMDFAQMIVTFDRYKVAFVSITQHFDTSTSMGRLILNVLLSFAQFEREIISERTRDKIAATRRKGKWSGGKPMLGYDLEGGVGASKLVVNETEAEQVRAIYALYLEKQSLIQVAKELAHRGWTTKQWTTRKGRSTGGKPYDKNILFKLITNALYVGKVRYKDELHTGEHQGIVDAGVWEKAQRMLRVNGRTGGSYTRNMYGALLKGLLYCRPCGLAMGHTFTSGKGNRRYRYYACYGAQKRGWDSCPSKSVPAEQIEQFVVDQIRAMGDDPTIRSLVLEQIRADGEQQVTALEGEAAIVQREVGHHGPVGGLQSDQFQQERAARGRPDGQRDHQTGILHRGAGMGQGALMKQFNDNAGRTWTVAINVDAIKRVKGLLDVNLLEIVEGTLIEKLIRDPVLLCDVVYAVCKPEADEKNVSDEDFGRAMAGDAIEHATTALLEELVGFSPNPRDRANLGRVLQTTARVMERARDLVAIRLDSGAIERAAEAEIQRLDAQLATSSNSSGSAPASSG